MAQIFWALGDFFTYVDPKTQRQHYGVVTSLEADAIVVVDSGLRTGRYTIESVFIPNNAVPADMKGVAFEVKMALCAVNVAAGRHQKVLVG